MFLLFKITIIFFAAHGGGGNILTGGPFSDTTVRAPVFLSIPMLSRSHYYYYYCIFQ